MIASVCTGEEAEVAEDAEVGVGGDEAALEQLLRQRRRERVRHRARVHLHHSAHTSGARELHPLALKIGYRIKYRNAQSTHVIPPASQNCGGSEFG